MEFIKDNIWLMAVFAVSGGMLLWPHLQNRGRTVSLLQATQMINQGKTVIVDVRDAQAFAAGHVRGAINIPLAELPQRLGELEKSKSKNVIVVCDTGARSAKASALLTKAGFAEVYGLNGGLVAWQGQGLPVAK